MMRQNRECVKIHSMFSLWISTLCCKVIVHQRRNIYIYLTKRAICIIFIYQVEFRLKFSFFFFLVVLAQEKLMYNSCATHWEKCTCYEECSVKFRVNAMKLRETQWNSCLLDPKCFLFWFSHWKQWGARRFPLKILTPLNTMQMHLPRLTYWQINIELH